MKLHHALCAVAALSSLTGCIAYPQGGAYEYPNTFYYGYQGEDFAYPAYYHEHAYSYAHGHNYNWNYWHANAGARVGGVHAENAGAFHGGGERGGGGERR